MPSTLVVGADRDVAKSPRNSSASSATAPVRWSRAQRLLHWLTAAAVATLWAAGYAMTRWIERESELQLTTIWLHGSLGFCVLVATFGRAVLRMRRPAPAPAAIPPVASRIARAGHIALYALLFAVPLSGWFMTESFDLPMNVFGIELPRVFGPREAFLGLPVDPWLPRMHALLAWSAAVVVAGHVLMVIKHLRIDGIDLRPRMRGERDR